MSKQGAEAFGRYLADYVAQSSRFPHATALAIAADISPSAISRWINGKERPSPRTLEKLAPVMGVDARQLFAIAYPEISGDDLRPADPLPLVLQQILEILADPKIPGEVKEQLLNAVSAAFDLWQSMYRLRAPRERPVSGRERAAPGR